MKGEISSVTKELKNENNKAEMLKHELNSLNFMINKQLDDI
jgi:predicted RNase H-like nuclease (RuvC/YqgF family)